MEMTGMALAGPFTPCRSANHSIDGYWEIWLGQLDYSGRPALRPFGVGLRPIKFVPDKFVEPLRFSSCRPTTTLQV